jgi:hypothetical protein
MVGWSTRWANGVQGLSARELALTRFSGVRRMALLLEVFGVFRLEEGRIL